MLEKHQQAAPWHHSCLKDNFNEAWPAAAKNTLQVLCGAAESVIMLLLKTATLDLKLTLFHAARVTCYACRELHLLGCGQLLLLPPQLVCCVCLLLLLVRKFAPVHDPASQATTMYDWLIVLVHRPASLLQSITLQMISNNHMVDLLLCSSSLS
jgi:hypothetical protein